MTDETSTDEIDLLTDVTLIELDTLAPYADNPKNHPDQQIAKIAQSIEQFGMDQPIVVDDDGTIIKGHGRYQAAQDLGLETIPVVWRDGLTPDEVTGARIADNKTSLESGFDYDTLATEFSDLEAEYDTADVAEMTGFGKADVDDILERGGTGIEEFLDQPDRDTADPEEDNEPSDDGSEWEDSDYDGVPPGEFECPGCGHTFTPSPADMGGGPE